MKYKYDLAVSFAGEQRPLADILARRLDASGYSILYDEFQQAELWGSDLSIALGNVYSKEARYCLIIVSSDYVAKPWTNHERQSAISQFIHRRSEYILCLRVDETELPGFPAVIGYVTLSKYGEDGAYKLLLQKLGPPNHENQLHALRLTMRFASKKYLKPVFRRAIYTRMDSEIHMRAMYDSIGAVLGVVQRITPRIHDQALQFACGEIIRALDEIERAKIRSPGVHSLHLPLIRELIRQMSPANLLWGAPRIHGELLKLGIQISQATVAKYMVRQRKPPSQTWRTFLTTASSSWGRLISWSCRQSAFACCLSS